MFTHINFDIISVKNWLSFSFWILMATGGRKNGNLGKESAGFVSFRAFGQALTEWVWADYVIYFVLISAVLLCYFKKYFLSCGIEPLHEQSLSRRSLILSTNLPARRLSVCLQTRFYWTLLRNGWVIKLSCIFHVSFFNVLISPPSTQKSHRPLPWKDKQASIDSLRFTDCNKTRLIHCFDIY